MESQKFSTKLVRLLLQIVVLLLLILLLWLLTWQPWPLVLPLIVSTLVFTSIGNKRWHKWQTRRAIPVYNPLLTQQPSPAPSYLKGRGAMESQKFSTKLVRLLLQIVVLLLLILLLWLLTWQPWPLVLPLIVSTLVFTSMGNKRWHEWQARRAIPVYNPLLTQQLSPAPSYQQGYQAQYPTRSATGFSFIGITPQPKADLPGAIYEQIQYPEPPLAEA